MSDLHPSIREIPMPPRIVGLPRDRRGFPVPWFVAWIDGEPDFRVAAAGKVNAAYFTGRCWICGGSLGRYRAYVVGPMCAVNRTSAEPPSHRDCAEYAAKACPFLARPHSRRRENDLPEHEDATPGITIKRNPGVALVWITERTLTKPDFNGGTLFDLGQPREVLWFAHGRAATRAEVLESIETGLPILRGMAEEDGDAAVAELEGYVQRAMTLVPADG